MTEIKKHHRIMISPKKYWKEFNYHDAILYCSLLKIDDYDDWKIPDADEMNIVSSYYFQKKESLGLAKCWLDNKMVWNPGGIVSSITNDSVLETKLLIRPIRKVLNNNEN
jgi:hypothetical protein